MTQRSTDTGATGLTDPSQPERCLNPNARAIVRRPTLGQVHSEVLRNVVAAHLDVLARHGRRDAARLLEGLREELSGTSNEFVQVIEDILDEASDAGELCRGMQFALMDLRREFATIAPLWLEKLWYEAFAAVGLASTKGHALYRLAIDHAYFQVVGAAEQAASALDLA